jgi:hypothetical protein
MRHPLQSRFDGALVGFAVVALAAVFFLVLLPGLAHVHKTVASRPVLLRSWPTSRVMGELGEYTQKIDCASIGATGLTGYLWVDQAHRRIVLICK